MTDPILLTPGPLTTSARTKAAMLHDWGSWDSAFHAVTASICHDLVAIAHGEASHVCVPMQGSGTFAVEATLGTLVPRDGKVLVPVNGAYGQRIVRILRLLGRSVLALDFPEEAVTDPACVEDALAADPSITHVALVHCETGTGILNPLPEIAAAVARQGRRLIVDAMSSFGAIPIDLRTLPIEALIAASGKCLEGVPGFGFVIADRGALAACAGNSHSLALDLYDQWRYLDATRQWRFTPPTHVVAALHSALAQYQEAGGLPAREARYQANCQALVEGMKAQGFTPFLAAAVQAPIIVTFHAPTHPAYDFKVFYQHMRERGFILYPGKLTQLETFRVGCIGAIDTGDIGRLLAAVAATTRAMGMTLAG